MNDEAIISQWNIDEYGNPISVKTEQETQVSVGGNLVQLRGIPDEMEGVTIEDKNGNTFFRVENLDEVYDSNYAYYLMKDGNVQFNPSQNGKLLYFKYYSKGVTLLSVSRIYYKDSYDNVVKILEDLIKAGFDALKVLEVFGGAKEVIDRLERDLDNGRALATQLEDVIAEGKPLQENLNADITEAKKWKDSLHKDVAEGKILQPQLHQDVIDGRETDANLTQTINSATELDDKIKTTGNASFIIEVDNWIASDDSDWAYMYSLTTSLNSSDLVFKTQEITTKGFEDCLLYSIVKDSNTIAFYTDDKVRTKVIINARQYGGTIQDFSVVNTDLISEGASNKYVTPQEKVNIGTIPDIKQQCELNKSSLEEMETHITYYHQYCEIINGIVYWDNALVNALNENGCVFFPDGEYNFKNEIVIDYTKCNRTIYCNSGFGKGKVKLIFNGTNAFRFSDDVRFVNIYGFYIVNKGDKLSTSAFIFGGTRNSKKSCHRVDLESMYIEGFKEVINIGEKIDGTADTYMILWNCLFNRIRTDNCDIGITSCDGSVYGHFGLTFDKVYFNQSITCIKARGLQGVFRDCNFGIQYTNVFDLDGSNFLTFDNCNFECEKLIDSVGNSIFNLGSSDIKFTNCIFRKAINTGTFFFNISTNAWSILFENCYGIKNGIDVETDFFNPNIQCNFNVLKLVGSATIAPSYFRSGGSTGKTINNDLSPLPFIKNDTPISTKIHSQYYNIDNKQIVSTDGSKYYDSLGNTTGQKTQSIGGGRIIDSGTVDINTSGQGVINFNVLDNSKNSIILLEQVYGQGIVFVECYGDRYSSSQIVKAVRWDDANKTFVGTFTTGFTIKWFRITS